MKNYRELEVEIQSFKNKKNFYRDRYMTVCKERSALKEEKQSVTDMMVKFQRLSSKHALEAVERGQENAKYKAALESIVGMGDDPDVWATRSNMVYNAQEALKDS